MALIMITHDLGVIAETVDRVVVMNGGRVMEEGPVQQVFDAPKHSYTQSLLASLTMGRSKTEDDAPAREAPALELRDLSKVYTLKRRGRIFSTPFDFHAVRQVSLVLPRNKIVGLVGESGSGKTTTGMMALRLIEPSTGQILVDGVDISRLDHQALKPYRRHMQVVFQDSYSALDPMMTLTQIITEPLHIHGLNTESERNTLALDWLERVGLDRNFGSALPT